MDRSKTPFLPQRAASLAQQNDRALVVAAAFDCTKHRVARLRRHWLLTSQRRWRRWRSGPARSRPCPRTVPFLLLERTGERIGRVSPWATTTLYAGAATWMLLDNARRRRMHPPSPSRTPRYTMPGSSLPETRTSAAREGVGPSLGAGTGPQTNQWGRQGSGPATPPA
jgi:hypothetical protein